MKLLFAVVLFIISNAVIGQNDTAAFRIYGTAEEDALEKVIQYQDKFIGVGTTGALGNANKNFFLVVFDSLLEIQQFNIFSSAHLQNINDVTIWGDKLFLLGYHNGWGNGGYDAYACMVKLSDYSLQWEKSIGGIDWDFGLSILHTNTNMARILIQEGVATKLVELDTAGHQLNAVELEHSDLIDIKAAIATSNNNVIVYGDHQLHKDSSLDFYVSKFDQDGHQLWLATKDIKKHQGLNHLIEWHGQFYGTGYTTQLSHDNKDYLFVQIDSLGNIIESKIPNYYPNDDEEGVRIIELDSNLFINGYTKSIGSGKEDVQFLGITNSGNLIDGYNYGWEEIEQPLDVYPYKNGYVIFGNTNSLGNGYYDFFSLVINTNYSKIGVDYLIDVVAVDQLIQSVEDNVNITNFSGNENVSIYNLTGQLLYSGILKEYKVSGLKPVLVVGEHGARIMILDSYENRTR